MSDLWTIKDVEYRVLEAAETLLLCPPVRGPKAYGNAMPEPVRDQKESYAYQKVRYRRVPTGVALDRMEETWTWVNQVLDEKERRFLNGWAYAKVKKGRSIRSFAHQEGHSRHWIRHEIERIIRRICDYLNESRTKNLTFAQNVQFSTSNHPSSENADRAYQVFWRADDARPEIPRDEPVVRLIKQRRNRRKRRTKK